MAAHTWLDSGADFKMSCGTFVKSRARDCPRGRGRESEEENLGGAEGWTEIHREGQDGPFHGNSHILQIDELREFRRKGPSYSRSSRGPAL